MEELVPIKRETRCEKKRKEERKEASDEESQGEEDLELNQNTDHYQRDT